MNEELKNKLIQFFKKNDSYQARRTLDSNGLSPHETMKLLELLSINYEEEISSFHRMQKEGDEK